MEEHQLDELTRRLARPVPRRTVLRAALAAALGGMASLATLGKSSAQTSTCSAVGVQCSPAGQYGPECCSGYCTAAGTCGCPTGRTYCAATNGGTPGCVPNCTGGQTLLQATCTCECPHGTALCKGTCTRLCPDGQALGPNCTCICPTAVCGTGGSGTCCVAGGVCCSGSCCSAGQACLNGTCTCPLGTIPCGTGAAMTCCPGGQCCVNGACTADCGTGQNCVNGTCRATCANPVCFGPPPSRCSATNTNCACTESVEGGTTCADLTGATCTTNPCTSSSQCGTGSFCANVGGCCGPGVFICVPFCAGTARPSGKPILPPRQ
ncbi:MAG: hypothetical protein JOZ41_03980 [Chloroflexi bacterium]|nr:hypothetical protein [Chloroflexota bacterium]